MIVLVDTSVWVAHLRESHPSLSELLLQNKVLMHPMVSGELQCGNLKNRAHLLGYLHALPAAKVARHDEILHMIELHGLWRRGLSFIDCSLLVSTLLSRCKLFSLDRALENAAGDLGVSFVAA